MTLRVTASRLSVVADGARFLHEARFEDGLNIIRAENNMGKSTVLMSILYALGWEGMLGPSRRAPFTEAVTKEIAQAEGPRCRVLESSAAIEVGGADGRRMTVQRPIVSSTEKTSLVHTWDGAALTRPHGAYEARDHYVREKEAAQREAGFHVRLARFVGWNLPNVPTWDGRSVPLYSEILAPFLFVEQTRGWAWIAAVMPRYLRVRDPERRATEFLLSLESLTRAGERDALLAEKNRVRDEWREVVSAYRGRVEDEIGVLKNVPANPVADWPPMVPPSVDLPYRGESRSMSEVLIAMRDEYASLTGDAPLVENVAGQLANDLQTAEERAALLGGQIAAAARDLRQQHGERAALDERIASLREDRARYDDAIRLHRLGSLEPLGDTHTLCPTCEQKLPATLIGTDIGPVMTLEDNRALLDQELKTFGAMRDDAEQVFDAARRQHAALVEELNDQRRTIRSLKSTLMQSGKSVSQELIARRVRLGDRIERLEQLGVGLVTLEERLAELAAQHRRLSGRLAKLGEKEMSSADGAKVAAFGDLVRQQLADYGFTSVPPDEISLAPDTYLPVRNGRSLLPDELSASDRVRMVWAYLVGLLEMARDRDTAHPGLLVLDEPGQQEINDESLRALFRRLARAREFGQQVIVATSKPADLVRELTGGADVVLQENDGYTLTPVRSDNGIQTSYTE